MKKVRSEENEEKISFKKRSKDNVRQIILYSVYDFNSNVWIFSNIGII